MFEVSFRNLYQNFPKSLNFGFETKLNVEINSFSSFELKNNSKNVRTALLNKTLDMGEL